MRRGSNGSAAFAGCPVIATRIIERHEAPGYGVLAIDPSGTGSEFGVVRVRSIVEMPRPA